MKNGYIRRHTNIQRETDRGADGERPLHWLTPQKPAAVTAGHAESRG